MKKLEEPYYEGEDHLDYPTLYDYLRLYNFRTYDTNVANKSNEFNTQTIRIFYNEDSHSWFEFGMYDFGSDVDKEHCIKTNLNPELLSRKVTSFFVDDDLDILFVYLQEERE